MAVSGFGNGKYFRYAGAVVSAAPMSIACRFYLSATPTGGQSTLCGIFNSGQDVNGNQQISLNINSGLNTYIKIGSSAGNSNATATLALSTSAWHSVVGVYSSATSYTCYMDGGNAGSNTVSRIPSGLDRTSIGIQDDATPNQSLSPDYSMAEVAIWDAALTAEHARQLGLGVWPLYVAPNNLIAYWPLSGHVSPEPDYIGGAAMTLQGAVTSGDHPPVGKYAGQFIVPSLVHTPVNSGVLTQTLADFTISATGSLLVQGALSVTLDDFTMTATDITQWAAATPGSTSWTPASGASTAWTPASGASTTWTPS